MLLHAGAFSNTTDAIVSAARLLETLLLTRQEAATKLVADSDKSRLLLQLLATHSGAGHAVAGAVMEVRVLVSRKELDAEVHACCTHACLHVILHACDRSCFCSFCM